MNYTQAKEHLQANPALIENLNLDYRPNDRAGNVHTVREPYPRTVAESLRDNAKYKPGTVAAVRAFAKDKPFRGDNNERFLKMAALHIALCETYGIFPRLRCGYLHGGHSGSSNFRPSDNVITMEGKLSVITYLHEFGHAMGKGEIGTCRWSLNLFRRFFPRSFARLNASGHTLIQS